MTYHKLLIAASEQCERLSIPYLHKSIHLHNLFKSNDSNSSVASIQTLAHLNGPILICKERGNIYDTLPLLSVLQNIYSSSSHNNVTTTVSVLIGPEGGFTPEELNQMNTTNNKKVQFVTLGENVLRAETAAIAAASCMAAVSCASETLKK